MEQDAGTTPPWSGTVNFGQTTAEKENMRLLSDVQLLANTWNTKIIPPSNLPLMQLGLTFTIGYSSLPESVNLTGQ